MQQRKPAAGRPLGTDGFDYSYRMVVDSRYTKVAKGKSRLRGLLISQAVLQVVGSLLVVLASQEKGFENLVIASLSIGFISLLIGELGRRHSQASLLRLYLILSAISISLTATHVVRSDLFLKTYSNRAACYTKLGALPEGLKDAEKCIELDPSFSKGYTRKGAIEFFMKEYDKALETYQEGLKHDPKNQELIDGVRRCIEQINRTNRGDISPEELKERQAKGMQDPEIQNILSDPIMRQVLVDLQENPKASQDHLKNPQVMHKIQKLISAGIVQMR